MVCAHMLVESIYLVLLSQPGHTYIDGVFLTVLEKFLNNIIIFSSL